MAGRRPRPSGPHSPRSPRAGRGKRYQELMKEQAEEAGSSKKQRSAGPDDSGVDKVVQLTQIGKVFLLNHLHSAPLESELFIYQ